MAHRVLSPPQRRRAIVFGTLGTLAGFGGAWLLWFGGTPTSITTGDGKYSDLTPRVYDAPPAMVAAFTKEATTRLLGWRVQQGGGDTNQVSVEVPSGLFTDDLTVTVSPEGNNSRVVIRSHSRQGPADFGRNARHIRQLQAAMDDKLPAANP